jgi:hypothetical protein
MKSSQKFMLWAFRMIFVLVLLIVVYPMSSYPAMWLCRKGLLPYKICRVYAPLIKGRKLFLSNWDEPEPLFYFSLINGVFEDSIENGKRVEARVCSWWKRD